jgi:EmrB/QacA subfamily drug resistance transporter
VPTAVTVRADQGGPATAARHPRRWLILGVICVATLIVVLDNSVLNVAIPSLTRELDASTADIQWMVNAYALVQSGLLLTAGNAADRYGRRRLLLAGLAVFGLGSLAAAFAETSGRLIAARAGMGVGGALLMTTTLAVVVQIFDEDERPRAIALWGVANSLGFVSGPLIGGALLDHFWWGSVFVVNLPVVAVGLVAVLRMVPESRNPVSARPDLPGAALSTLGMAGAVYAIISGPEHGWADPVRVLLPATVAALALTGFVLWERHAAHPMVDLGLFRDPRFLGPVAGDLLIAFGVAGSLYLLTQQLQFVHGYSPLEAGVRTAPLALVFVVLNLAGAGPRLMARAGIAATALAGMVLLAAGLALVPLLSGHGYPGVLTGLVVAGLGFTFASPAMATALLGALPPEKAGVGAGVSGTLAEFGGGLGVAVLGAVLAARFGPGPSLPDVLAAAGTGAERADATGVFASGLHIAQYLGAASVLAGGLLSVLLLRRAERPGAPRRQALASAAAVRPPRRGGTALCRRPAPRAVSG